MKTDQLILDHEHATIKAFVVRDKQERLLSFAASPKNRKKFTSELPHFRWFDKRYASPVKWNSNPPTSSYGIDIAKESETSFNF